VPLPQPASPRHRGERRGGSPRPYIKRDLN
jgi:hypothetical protein